MKKIKNIDSLCKSLKNEFKERTNNNLIGFTLSLYPASKGRISFRFTDDYTPNIGKLLKNTIISINENPLLFNGKGSNMTPWFDLELLSKANSSLHNAVKPKTPNSYRYEIFIDLTEFKNLAIKVPYRYKWDKPKIKQQDDLTIIACKRFLGVDKIKPGTHLFRY